MNRSPTLPHHDGCRCEEPERQALLVEACPWPREKQYTLAEAQAELARRECVRIGHTWSVISTLLRPVRIVCDTCGKTYRIEENQ